VAFNMYFKLVFLEIYQCAHMFNFPLPSHINVDEKITECINFCQILMHLLQLHNEISTHISICMCIVPSLLWPHPLVLRALCYHLQYNRLYSMLWYGVHTIILDDQKRIGHMRLHHNHVH